MGKNKMIDQKKLKEILIYNDQSGFFTWKISAGRAINGNIAGTEMRDGYRSITIEGKHYMEHRLAWLYMYGVMPKNYIDHINGFVSDNRILNLRECLHAENHQNRKLQNNNTTGYTGVVKTKNGKYEAKIKCNGKKTHIGTFDSALIAYNAYLSEKIKLHNFNPHPVR
jgi:hypothetical protein